MKGYLKYHILDRAVLLRKKVQLALYKNNEPILVHTMAKVGSLSVYTSLKLALPRTAVFHTHNLDLKQEIRYKEYCFKNHIFPSSRSSVALIQEKIFSVGRRYKIITLYRDPIERNISAFFDAFKLYVGIEPRFYKGSLSDLEELFHQHIPHSYPLNWFDDFLKPETDIDVYRHDFNSEQGHMRINSTNFDLLIVKSSLSNKKKEDLIGEFCEVSDFKIKDTNLTSESKYANLYSEFKNYIRFTDDYLNHQYNSNYAKHFFKKAERLLSMDKWRKI